MSMAAMVADMRNRFLVALIFTVPIVLWSGVGSGLIGSELADPVRDRPQLVAFVAEHAGGPVFVLDLLHRRVEGAARADAGHDGAGRGRGGDRVRLVPLFQVKHRVEQHIRSLLIAHTILAPVYFMENLFNPWNVAALQAATFPSPIPVELPLKQVAIADVARLAALAIERPGEFAGQRITLASDELTAEQAAQVLSGGLDRDFTAGQLPTEELPPGLRALFEWLERTGHGVDLGVLHDRYPEVGWHDYKAWVRYQRARLRELCPREHAGAR